MRLIGRTRPWGYLFTASGVIAVGLGLGAMVFALADPVLRRLPYADPDRLVSISFSMPTPGAQVNPADVPPLASWQARTDLFVGLAAFEGLGWMRVRVSDRVVALRAVAATDNLLDVLGVHASNADSDPTASWITSGAATLLSNEELRTGQSLPLVPAGVLRVRGVLPRSFLLPQANRMEPVDAITPLAASRVIRIEGVSSTELNIVARLRPDVTPQMVEAALNVTMAPAHRRVTAVPLSMTLNARLRDLATGASLASLLLVVACWTNVFSLAVTRGLYRRAEMVTRTALGATPRLLAGLLGREALSVAALGCGGALAVTWLGLAVTLPGMPPQFATLGAPAMTSRVAFYIVIAAIIAGVAWYVASLLALVLSRRRQSLHVISRDGRAIRLVRFAVIAGQLGAASLLLVASALLSRSYLNLLSVETGLDDRLHTVTVGHDPTIPVALRRGLVEQTISALRGIGGVTAAGASAGGLLNGRTNVGTARIDGRLVLLDRIVVAGDYFPVMGLTFLAGSAPEPGDASAAVITESAAAELRGVGAWLGSTLSVAGALGFQPVKVVGVVRDVRSRSLSVPPRPAIYLQTDGWLGTQPETTYFLRLAEQEELPVPLERVVRGVDPLAIVLNAGSVRARMHDSIRDRAFATTIIGAFALASVLMAALGLAGVVAYTVVRRTREIAIRLALGATVRSMTTLVVRDAVMAAIFGIAGGVIASIWLSAALESFLYGIAVADALTLIVTAAGLLVAVLAAATLPGLRAGRVSPATALRAE